MKIEQVYQIRIFSNFTGPYFLHLHLLPAFLCKAVLFKPGRLANNAQWCCTSQRPGANNSMSMLRAEVSPSPCWRRKSLSWWVKILSKLQCHVPWSQPQQAAAKDCRKIRSEMGFRKLEYVSFLICEGKSPEISIAGKHWHTDWTWSDALCYCQIVLLHKRNNTKARCPTVLQEGLCFLPIGARFRAQVLRWPGAFEWWLDLGGTRQGSDVDYLTSSRRFGVNRPIKCHAVVTQRFFTLLSVNGFWMGRIVWFGLDMFERYIPTLRLHRISRLYCIYTLYVNICYIYTCISVCVCWNLSWT